ncbi:MAG TPA: pilus assembly PilX N-terminal domain-containing protein, partial [Nocardioidaceae bacterium]
MMLRRVHAQAADERGAALVVTIGITAIITALAVVSATVSINNMKNATRDKQANSALATSEAGVAEAIEFLRSGTIGLSQLTCAEPAPAVDPATACPTSATNPANWWTNSQAPKEVPVDGAASCTPGETCYKVWIGTVTAYKPPLQTFGVYRVHSTGKFGGGPATRSVVVEVKVKPYPFPIGVYADTLTGGGNADLTRESLFTRSCVSQRQTDSSPAGGLRFAPGVDLQYDLPPTAHTTDHISTGNNCQSNGYIHPANAQGCNTSFRYDQSMDGKPESAFSSSSCYKSWTSPTGSGKQYPLKSQFTIQDLQSFGYRPRGLSDQVYDTLKARAQAAGTYFTTSSGSPYTALNALGGAQAVLYYNVPSNTTIHLGPTDI